MHNADLIEAIERRSATLTVIGQGYVGLPLAVAFGEAGFVVRGLENDLDRVGVLNQGTSYIPDVESERLRRLVEQGRYAATADPAVLAESDVIIICVPTPLRKSKDPDISYVVAAAERVAKHLRRGQLIILESTTYPGTTEELLLPMVQERGFAVGRDVFLAFSPERIDPGNPTFKVNDIPKVVGGLTAECTKRAALVYRQIVRQVTEVSSPKVAELAKLYENVFRNVNIALANEFSLMCQRLGVSSREVIDAAATKPFGFMPFYPGPGIGGHCIPVDPGYLAWKMRLSGYEARFIHLADEINRSMPDHVIELVVQALNERERSVKGSRLLVLGVAYKRGVGDVRESPALEIIAALEHKGAAVRYVDPYVPSVVVESRTHKSVALVDEELQRADAVVILTDHPDFDYRAVVKHARLVIDTRNATWGIDAPGSTVIRL